MRIPNLSSLTTLPLPNFCKTWRGREITLATLATLSVALITYIAYKIFFKPKEEKKVPFDYQTPRRNPIISDEMDSPSKLRGFEKSLEPACDKVFFASRAFPEKRSMPIEEKITTYLVNFDKDKDVKLKERFEKSVVYFNDTLSSITVLEDDTLNESSNVPKEIASFLRQLSTVAETIITDCFPDVIINKAINSDIQISISTNNGKPTLVINNIEYDLEGTIYQIYLIAKLDQDCWKISSYLTRWVDPAQHFSTYCPLMKEMVPEEVNLSSLGEYACINLGFLEEKTLANFDLKPPKQVWAKKFGSILGLDDLVRKLPQFALSAIPDQNFPENVAVSLLEEKLTIAKNSDNTLVNMHVLVGEEKRHFEICLFLKIRTSFNFFGPNSLQTATIQYGFYGEHSKNTNKHPLVARFPALVASFPDDPDDLVVDLSFM